MLFRGGSFFFGANASAILTFLAALDNDDDDDGGRNSDGANDGANIPPPPIQLARVGLNSRVRIGPRGRRGRRRRGPLSAAVLARLKGFHIGVAYWMSSKDARTLSGAASPMDLPTLK